MVLPSKVSPLADSVPIVRTKDGTPTTYFVRQLQQLLDEKANTDDLAAGAIQSSDLTEILEALELDDLADVDVTTTPPSDGDALTWDNSSSLWIPGTGGGGAGGDLGALHMCAVSATNAGGVTASYAARGLNTVVSNTISGAVAVPSATVTITIASPGVVTWNAHGLANGTAVMIATTGALPTGLTADFPYYVVSATTNTFQLSLTDGGAAINTSGTQSGTHTASAGVFDLPAGTYDIEGEYAGIFSGVAGWRSRLYNVTDAVEQPGTIGSMSAGNVNHYRTMTVKGRFTIASTKRFAIQTIASGTVATFGMGTSGLSGRVNVFTNTFIRRLTTTTPVPTCPWTLIYSNAALTNPTTSIDLDVQNYDEVMIIGRAVTLASSGYRGAFVSVNGGSTYYNTNGDYVNQTNAGVEANNFICANHNTATTAARNFGGIFRGIRTNGAPKAIQSTVEYDGNRTFVASNSPITHIRIGGIAASAGALINMTGGQVYVYAR